MAEPTWGLLEKSQVDNETIEQAIARLIQAHEDDAGAHAVAGESLETHKGQTTIDHPAGSVIDDKIPEDELGSLKLKYDKVTIATSWESLDNWVKNLVGTGSIEDYMGELRLFTGGDINSISDVHAEVFSEGYGARMTRNPRFMMVVALDDLTNQEIYLFAGNFSEYGFGFKVVNGTLNACHQKDAGEWLTDITGALDLTAEHRYKAIYTTGSKIEFYVDDVLKATHNANLPEDDADEPDSLEWMRLRIKNTAAADKSFHCRYAILIQDS